MIGKVMERFFEPVAPRAQTTLSWVRDLQRIEISLQNKLSQDQRAVLTDITRTLETKLVDYNTFANFRKSMIILTCLWERSTNRIFGRESPDFTAQLIENQLKAISAMEPGIVRKRLSHVIARCVQLRANGHCLHPTTVMARIEDDLASY